MEHVRPVQQDYYQKIRMRLEYLNEQCNEIGSLNDFNRYFIGLKSFYRNFNKVLSGISFKKVALELKQAKKDKNISASEKNKLISIMEGLHRIMITRKENWDIDKDFVADMLRTRI